MPIKEKNYFDIFDWLKTNGVDWEEIEDKTINELWEMKISEDFKNSKEGETIYRVHEAIQEIYNKQVDKNTFYNVLSDENEADDLYEFYKKIEGNSNSWNYYTFQSQIEISNVIDEKWKEAIQEIEFFNAWINITDWSSNSHEFDYSIIKEFEEADYDQVVVDIIKSIKRSFNGVIDNFVNNVLETKDYHIAQNDRLWEVGCVGEMYKDEAAEGGYRYLFKKSTNEVIKSLIFSYKWAFSDNESDFSHSKEFINKKLFKNKEIEIIDEDEDSVNFYIKGINGLFVLYKHETIDYSVWDIVYNGWDDDGLLQDDEYNKLLNSYLQNRKDRCAYGLDIVEQQEFDNKNNELIKKFIKQNDEKFSFDELDDILKNEFEKTL